MIIDFRRIKHQIVNLEINGHLIEQVASYKYLGVTIDNKLTWSDHCQIAHKKAHQRLHYQKKLRTFGINKKIIELFYNATVASLITFGITCWFGNASVRNKKKASTIS